MDQLDFSDKEGHAFGGWSLKNNDSIAKYQPNEIQKFNTSVDLYAVWQKNQYIISTKTDTNGTIDKNQNAKYGENRTINYQANPGYKINEILIDDNKIDVFHNMNAYTFTNINKDHKVEIKTVKDEKQTKELNYVVKHVVDGSEKDQETIKEVVWVNSADQLSVRAESIKEKSYVGYKLESINPTSIKGGDLINNNGIITLNYVKDEAQTKVLSYTVEHWIDGESSARNSAKFSKVAWINDQDKLEIQTGSLDIKVYSGYKFRNYDHNVYDMIENNATIKVNYIKVLENIFVEQADNNQTFSTIYYLDGVEYAKYNLPIGSKVPLLDSPTLNSDLKFDGWIGYEKVQPGKTLVIYGKTSMKTVIIEDEDVALSSGSSSWALINWILCILTIAISLILLIGYFVSNKDEEDDYRNRHILMRISSVAVAIVAILFFIITENMSYPMVLVDKWTAIMVLIALVQVVLYFIIMKKKNSDVVVKE